jgi:glycosyltransferase involved in cell wall biosynthesis
MGIAFFGLKQAFDYFQIGGTESFVRRLSINFLKKGIEVDYILYGASVPRELNHAGINLKYIKSFEDALSFLKKAKYEHIITIYLLPKDRLRYAFFRKIKGKSCSFHFVYFGWPDSSIKRKLCFAEARLFPYNGRLFCISKRQYQYVSNWARNAVYILPPVPESYFLKPEGKPVNEKIKVSFLGRIDPGKGINEVTEIFDGLIKNDRFECSIYGIHIPEDKESFEIHNRLKKQKEIKYIEVDRQKYSSAVEDFVRNILKETDIFIHPYQKLSSTIDTPLLLLEAMASLCAVIMKPFGNIPDIYGKSRFLVSPKRFVQDAIKLLHSVSNDDLVKERKRVYAQNKNLNFIGDAVAKRFINAING